ncbi:Uncharacterized conserved protein, contains HEPN domain [Sulfobacillus thermosulfidooxidans DSM 9293]|uniref:Uncharacterized conserved protein, contains HEPN domain n=2 Tax=Sulfobacillus thermosulfidooxidans TaxID=28034 RepID=A0A1W1WKD1_SULTA|nr:DUF86 domain-containing protein [Sulfobacillus thermosulfidooxidans]PSR29501.1 MAG: DUF86 domain-containing protein [Sulfobacillus thermosulfidooxidans]SMC06726.1 Uncharacterized conserved protein, contains HEPN domain [Sulfobacillus thermosulfidooxidans DSM 9293]
MPKRDNFSALTHIEEAVQRIRRWTERISYQKFLDDEIRQSAVIRQLEIIGEATGRLTAEFLRAHPNLPWNVMKSMRNLLIHGYDEVDIDMVWTTATEDIPHIHAPLQKLISEVRNS